MQEEVKYWGKLKEKKRIDTCLKLLVKVYYPFQFIMTGEKKKEMNSKIQHTRKLTNSMKLPHATNIYNFYKL